jgi:hypothetical protein
MLSVRLEPHHLRWFKYNFGHEFGKLFDKLNILRNRKIDLLRFLHKRMRATEKWMEERNGRRQRFWLNEIKYE